MEDARADRCVAVCAGSVAQLLLFLLRKQRRQLRHNSGVMSHARFRIALPSLSRGVANEQDSVGFISRVGGENWVRVVLV